jgi:DNA-directed RNA polymerase beta subunit
MGVCRKPWITSEEVWLRQSNRESHVCVVRLSFCRSTFCHISAPGTTLKSPRKRLTFLVTPFTSTFHSFHSFLPSFLTTFWDEKKKKKRLLNVVLDRKVPDDRDHFSNKRLDLAGPLVGSLFRQLFRDLKKKMKAISMKVKLRPQPQLHCHTDH